MNNKKCENGKIEPSVNLKTLSPKCLEFLIVCGFFYDENPASIFKRDISNIFGKPTIIHAQSNLKRS